MTHKTTLVDVFTQNGHGGNPCPIVLDASAMEASSMQAIAQTYGHECAFVLPVSDSESDFAIRFFVPGHEMEMCGHATLGSLWLLRHARIIGDGLWRVRTQSGIVRGRVDGDSVRLSQPAAVVQWVDAADRQAVLDVLGISLDDLASPLLCNASTSRTKTLVHLVSAQTLNSLRPRFAAMQALCERLGSTGLYPFARRTEGQPAVFEARQFPCASGYPEDAATGIAATALVGALDMFQIDVPLHTPVTIFQGRAMGRTSCLHVTRETPDIRSTPFFWLSGAVTLRILPPSVGS